MRRRRSPAQYSLLPVRTQSCKSHACSSTSQWAGFDSARWSRRSFRSAGGEGDYRVALRGFGWLPLGEQIISIRIRDNERELHDHGSSRFFRRWVHRLSVEPDGAEASRYTDRVDFDAGPLNSILLPLLQNFFRHRQRRWRCLVENGFNYSA